MRTNLIFCFLLMFSFVIAQDIVVSDEVNIRSTTYYDLVGQVNNKTFLIVGENDAYTAHAFDNQRLHEKWKRDLKFDKKTAKLIGTLAQKDHFLVFYQYRKKGDNVLKVRKYDDQLRMLDSTTIHIFKNRTFSPDLDFILSDNKKKILFIDAERERQVESVAYDVETMETLWHNRFKPENYIFYENFVEAIIDNDGYMHVVLERDNKRYKRESNRFIIYHVGKGITGANHYTVSMAGQTWYDVDFSFDNLNKKLIGCGLYSEKKSTDVTGYFYLKADPKDPENPSIAFNVLDREDLVKLFGKSIKKNRGFEDVVVQDIIHRRDGGALMVVERMKEYVRQTGATTSSPYSGRERFAQGHTDYYHDDLLLLSIHPNGKLHWQEVLHKKQFSQDDNGAFSSYFLMKTKRNLRLIYNDEVKFETSISEYIVQGNGNSQRKALFGTEGKKLKLRIRDSLQLSPNTLLIPSERRNRLRLVLLTYE